MSEELEGKWQANEDTLHWFNILNSGVESITGQFGFIGGVKVFVVHKKDDIENAIAIPEEVMKQALQKGWFKRGNKR